ncbi:MAG: ABC transporter permease [Fimbriimonas sp.]
MESTIFLYALKDNFRPKKLLPWVLLGIFCAALAYFWSYLMPESTDQDQYSQVSLILVYRVVALASVIFTTAIISQEVEQRTIVYLLTRPVPRWMLLVYRFAASVITVFALGVFAAICTHFGAFQGLGNNSVLLRDIGTIAIASLAYGGLFLFISLLFNRSMIICLLFAFGWESLVPNISGQIYKSSIFSYLQAIARHPESTNKGVGFASGSLATNTITTQTALLAMAGLIVVTVLISAWWFTHFEYVPREDAE